MRYFKIRIGYGKEDDRYISIGEGELESALHCFITDSKGVFKNGVCRGSDIISITEDWHKEMGWNETHVIIDDDWNELKAKGITGKYTGVLAQAKENVQLLMQSGRADLIGKIGTVNERLGILPTPEKKQIDDGRASLAAKMKI